MYIELTGPKTGIPMVTCPIHKDYLIFKFEHEISFEDIDSLLLKVVKIFCLQLKISITTKPIEFSLLGKLHMDRVMYLGYFIFRLVIFLRFPLRI